MSDDALGEGPPERKVIEADDEIRRSVGMVMWFRRRFEAETFKSKRCIGFSKIVDYPEKIDGNGCIPIPEMMFAIEKELVGVKALTYQSSRAEK
ncbi:hypothetical protein Bca101_023627 [Brassica carinata]